MRAETAEAAGGAGAVVARERAGGWGPEAAGWLAVEG